MCNKIKNLLGKWKIPFQEVRVDLDRAGLVEMARLTNGARTVPQVAIDGKWIGGLMELTELHMENKLDELVVDNPL